MWLGALAGVAGCAASGAVAPAPKEAQPATEREPATIEEAQAQLDRARTDLGTAPGWAAGPSTATTPGATTTSESTTGAAGPAAPREAACASACRAMSSMRRAVDAICRLAGQADPRCTDARRTLKDSEAKVAGCGC